MHVEIVWFLLKMLVSKLSLSLSLFNLQYIHTKFCIKMYFKRIPFSRFKEFPAFGKVIHNFNKVISAYTIFVISQYKTTKINILSGKHFNVYLSHTVGGTWKAVYIYIMNISQIRHVKYRSARNITSLQSAVTVDYLWTCVNFLKFSSCSHRILYRDW